KPGRYGRVLWPRNPVAATGFPMRAAVVIATFDQPRWLRLVLRAWQRQGALLIVADDGSGPETAEVIRAAGAEHVRLERDGPLGKAIDALLTRRTPFKGGNTSCFLDDFYAVNGYDERFGWGVEDKELGERMQNAGIRGFSLRYSAPVFHLWHDRPYVDSQVIA